MDKSTNRRADTLDRAIRLIRRGYLNNFIGRLLVSNLLQKIDDESIGLEIGMAEMPLIVFLLSIKHRINPELTCINDNKDVMLSYGDYNVANISYLPLYLHFLSFEKGILTIEGTTSFPAILEQEDFIVKADRDIYMPKLYEAGQDLRIGETIYETRKGFRFEISLKSDMQIEFYNRIMGIDVPCRRINSMRFSPIADCIENQFFESDGWCFSVKGNSILCRKISSEKKYLLEKEYRKSIEEKYPEKAEWVKKLREYYYEHQKCKTKQIWLFMDRPDRADDNAKVLFKYVQNKKEIDSYFLLTENSVDYAEMNKIGKVISIYSEDHYKLALTADYIISSQCNGLIENPFWDDSEFFRDLYHRPKIIFLQHGTIKDDMSPTLNRFNTNFTGFITGTKAEFQSIIDYPYHYTEKEVWLTGQPRFDELYDAEEKIILFMPSWRKNLMEQAWDEESHDMKWRMRSDFEKTDFYRHYRALFTDKKLRSACMENGYRMLLCLHPLMREYAEQLVTGTICETAASEEPYRELFAKASILITDYSSVAFDFSYLRKPIIYYQFDRKEFFKSHTYRQGYFDYEQDGFGPVCHTRRKIIKEIVMLINGSGVTDNTYAKRSEELWPYSGDYCKRVYKKIKSSEV